MPRSTCQLRDSETTDWRRARRSLGPHPFPFHSATTAPSSQTSSTLPSPMQPALPACTVQLKQHNARQSCGRKEYYMQLEKLCVWNEKPSFSLYVPSGRLVGLSWRRRQDLGKQGVSRGGAAPWLLATVVANAIYWKGCETCVPSPTLRARVPRHPLTLKRSINGEAASRLRLNHPWPGSAAISGRSARRRCIEREDLLPRFLPRLDPVFSRPPPPVQPLPSLSPPLPPTTQATDYPTTLWVAFQLVSSFPIPIHSSRDYHLFAPLLD